MPGFGGVNLAGSVQNWNFYLFIFFFPEEAKVPDSYKVFGSDDVNKRKRYSIGNWLKTEKKGLQKLCYFKGRYVEK